MQISSTCFKDKQIKSMIESYGAYGNCEITGDIDCIIYDTDKDGYLEEYFEEIIDIFVTKDKIYNGISEEKTDYIKNFLLYWNIFSVGANEIQKILIAVCKNII